MNRPKDIGTAAETALVRYLNVNGWPNAERRALRGNQDTGDVTGCPDICWESKAGKAAWEASDNQIKRWLAETETERIRAGVSIGILVVARRQRPVAERWAVMTMAVHQRLLGHPETASPLAGLECRTTVENAVTMLRAGGWGEPA